jgi:hypothetical protein
MYAPLFPMNPEVISFSRKVRLLKIYSKVSQGMTGKIGIKLHTGEQRGPNLLPIELIKGLQPHIPNSTIVECNVPGSN